MAFLTHMEAFGRNCGAICNDALELQQEAEATMRRQPERKAGAECFPIASDTTNASLPSFSTRSAESRRILTKYPDRIPVICEKAHHSALDTIDKNKFLLPRTMLIGEFTVILLKHLECKRLDCDLEILLIVTSDDQKHEPTLIDTSETQLSIAAG